ncbi:MAG: fumarylacetoacetate hydrolase family protein [Cyanophyceae cyanobacterium]
MKLGTVLHDGKEILGLAAGSNTAFYALQPIYTACNLGVAPFNLRELILGGESSLNNAGLAQDFAESNPEKLTALLERDFTWLPPVNDSRKIIGVAMNNTGLNTGAHVEPAGPMFFLKPLSSLTGHNQPIEIGDDYGFTFPELELAVVIGKAGKNISEEDALSHVFGYSIMNDVTSQGLKRGDSIAVDLRPGLKHTPGYLSYFDWRRVRGEEDNEVYFTYHTRSKGSDTFGPMGPWVTTADEIANPDDLAVRGYADGELFAEDSTSAYSYTVSHIIAHASRYFSLEPGDIFTCGTAAKGNEQYPRAHHEIDMSESTPVVEIQIEGLGSLSNPVRHI